MAENLTLIERFRKWYMRLPDKKRYFEFLSALLTIPVLLTIILLNWGNLKNNKQEQKPAPTVVREKVITVIPSQDKSLSPTPTASPACKKEVGPVEITSPKENEVVTSQPVCFTIEYNDPSYCSVVWSYRIDNSSYSDFTDKSVCLYNLSSGNHKFELRVKSVVSDDDVNLVRNFVFQGSNPTPTTSQSQ